MEKREAEEEKTEERVQNEADEGCRVREDSKF